MLRRVGKVLRRLFTRFHDIFHHQCHGHVAVPHFFVLDPSSRLYESTVRGTVEKASAALKKNKSFRWKGRFGHIPRRKLQAQIKRLKANPLETIDEDESEDWVREAEEQQDMLDKGIVVVCHF